MLSIRQLVHRRSLRLVMGLAVAIAIPACALAYLQFRSIRDLEQTSAVVLETLGGQVADSISVALKSSFERPAYEMERTDHLAVEQLDVPKVTASLREHGGAVSIVDAFYIWSVHGKDVLELINRPHAHGPAPPEFEPAGEESARFVALANQLAAYRLPWGMSIVEVDGRPQAVVVHLLFDSSARARLSSFIGFRVDLERPRREELPRMLAPLTAEANRRSRFATLVADLVDDKGREIYRSHPSMPLRVVQQRTLPLVFFAPDIMPAPQACEGCMLHWTLRVGYGEGTAEAIARDSTRWYRTLLLALLLVLISGVVLAARTALGEMRLAEARSHFVASVSHELKTPLALIQLFAETLQLNRVKSPERAKEYYAIINAEAKKLGALINNVLDFSRIESGFRMYQLKPVDLGGVVARVVHGMETHLSHEGFAVSVDISSGLPAVLADEEAVELAVGNLLSNAAKYSVDARRIGVDVSAAPGAVNVSVRDHGIGIARRHQRKVFQKFYRVESEQPGAPRGCGLGLAIVDQVMRAHRGRVLVESEPGHGSTFTLVFPSTAESQPDEANPRDRRRATDAAGAA